MIQNHLYEHGSGMCGKESNERQPASYCYKKGLVHSQDNVHRTLHALYQWVTMVTWIIHLKSGPAKMCCYCIWYAVYTITNSKFSAATKYLHGYDRLSWQCTLTDSTTFNLFKAVTLAQSTGRVQTVHVYTTPWTHDSYNRSYSYWPVDKELWQ